VYHLQRLEDASFVHSRREGLYRRFYVQGSDPADREPRSTREKVLQQINQQPGIHGSEIARRFETTRQLVAYHVDKLLGEALVEAREAEQKQRLYPAGDASG
jgi:predicted transcriptional regulator